MRRALAAASKAGWNLGDQVLSALSNVLLAIVIARNVDAQAFGAFAIAFAIFGIGIAIARAVVGQPLQVRYSSAEPAQQRAAAQRSHGLAVVLGVALGALCAGAGWLFGGALGASLIAVGVSLPGLLLQDSQRLAFFAIGPRWGAVVVDTVRIVALFAVLLWLIDAGHTAVETLVLGWGLTALLGCVAGFLVLRALPRVRDARRWIAETRDLTGYYLAEYVLGLGASQVSLVLVAVIASQEAVGALRAAQTLLGPLNILGTALFGFTIPEIARRPHLRPSQRLLAGHAISGLMGLAAVVYVTILVLIPDWLGVELFGDSWAGAASVMLFMGISSVFSALANGIAGVLYGLGQAKASFRINLAKTPVILVAVLGGAWIGGAVGAAIGMAVAEAYVLPLWYVAFRKAAKKPQPAPGAAPAADPEPGVGDPPAGAPGTTDAADAARPPG